MLQGGGGVLHDQVRLSYNSYNIELDGMNLTQLQVKNVKFCGTGGA